jgi:asparagine synthase (glutamine-hydrolysing)
VEFAATVPDRLRLRGAVGKYILKRAVENMLPREIVYRKKMGFPTPLRQWLMEPEADTLFAQLRDRDGLLAPYIDFTYLNGLLSRHKSGREDATDRIWRLLNLQLWGKIFITNRMPVAFACS